MLASFKLGNGCRIGFWTDPWISQLPLKVSFPTLVRITNSPSGSVQDHWDSSSSSWSLSFRRLLKEEEIVDFQSLLQLISSKRVNENMDRCVWTLKASGSFSVKSLSRHLSVASPLEKQVRKALWKTRRVNILVWILLFGKVNCSSVMQ